MLASFAVAPLRQELPPRKEKPLRDLAYRWSRFIQHRPWPVAIAATLFLLVLAMPVLGLRLGFSDEGNFAEDTTTRAAYDLTPPRRSGPAPTVRCCSPSSCRRRRTSRCSPS